MGNNRVYTSTHQNNLTIQAGWTEKGMQSGHSTCSAISYVLSETVIHISTVPITTMTFIQFVDH